MFIAFRHAGWWAGAPGKVDVVIVKSTSASTFEYRRSAIAHLGKLVGWKALGKEDLICAALMQA